MAKHFLPHADAWFADVIAKRIEEAQIPTVFNPVPNDPLKEPMFFGNGVNTSRFDIQKYPNFDRYTEKQLGFFWMPTEIGLGRDIVEYQRLTEVEKHIFNANLKYQTFLDSFQGRAPIRLLLPLVSLPEMEPWLNIWSMFESTIHSRSYSYIIQAIHPNPDEILGSIVITPEIMERAKAIAVYADKLGFLNSVKEAKEWGLEFSNMDVDVESEEFKREHAKALILYLFTTYLLEMVRFYVSFSCTFSFAERKESVMEGNAKIVRLIARDEQLHGAVVNMMLNNIRFNENEWWAEVYQECIPEMIKIAHDCREQEHLWNRYLFQYGGIPGINLATSDQYLDHLIDHVCGPIGLPSMFGNKKNPYPWIKNWLDSAAIQVAPQETEQTNYTLSVDSSDSDISDLGGMLDD